MRAAVAIALVGCASPGPYPCTIDSQCVHAGEQGVCQPHGYCSFLDISCAFGQRFDATADPELAGSCVTYDGIGCIAQIALGSAHSCARDVEGHLYCWGAGESGQIGDGSTPSTQLAQTLVIDGSVTQVAAGDDFTCAIANDSVLCWGDNNTFGKLGDPTLAMSSRSSPMPAAIDPALGPPRRIATGEDHACAALATDTACWGLNGNGQLGLGDKVDGPTPRPIGTRYDELAAGGHHTCGWTGGILGGPVQCWGSNLKGQIGSLAATFDQIAPIDVDATNLNGTVQLALGDEFSCARTVRGDVFCWGEGSTGELGIGVTGDKDVPNKLTSLENVIAIGAGREHACALDAFGVVLCWGANAIGQLGIGTIDSDPHPTPQPIAGVTDAIALAVGYNHACAQRRDGTLMCWGSNGNARSVIGNTDLLQVAMPTAAGFTCR